MGGGGVGGLFKNFSLRLKDLKGQHLRCQRKEGEELLLTVCYVPTLLQWSPISI